MWINAGATTRRSRSEIQVSDAVDVWTQVTLSLRSQLAESVWFSTFQDLTPLDSDTDTLRLMAPSAYVRDRIMTRYLPLVTEALHDANEGQRNVEIDVATNERSGRRRPDDAVATNELLGRAEHVDLRPERRIGATPNERRRPIAADRSLLDEAGLNPRYTFETFVKGASNQFALAAALRVAETPGRAVQPAVHLRRGRPRQDPPAARHRPLRPPQLPAPRGALRLHRDVPQRVRRRHPHQHERRASSAATATSTCCSSTTSSSSRARKGSRRSSSTRSTPSTAPTSRSSSPPTACPTPSPRSRTGCAAGSSGA